MLDNRYTQVTLTLKVGNAVREGEKLHIDATTSTCYAVQLLHSHSPSSGPSPVVHASGEVDPSGLVSPSTQSVQVAFAINPPADQLLGGQMVQEVSVSPP